MDQQPATKSEATRLRLLDAAERLYVTLPMTEVTTRAIAEEADCSVGLAYRYFASKEELMGAVLDRAAEHITQGMNPSDPPGVLAAKAWQRMKEKPVFARLMAHVLMENGDLGEIMSGFPFLRIAANQAVEANDPDPTTAAASLGSLILGHAFFAPILNTAVNRAPDDDRIDNRLGMVAAAIHTTNPTP